MRKAVFPHGAGPQKQQDSLYYHQSPSPQQHKRAADIGYSNAIFFTVITFGTKPAADVSTATNVYVKTQQGKQQQQMHPQ
jgi:hypothetical protein